MSRPSWGHHSRHCLRCGKVGPRVIVLGGWIHARCRSIEEARKARAETLARKAAARAKAEREKADLAQQFAEDKERYFPEPDEVLG